MRIVTAMTDENTSENDKLGKPGNPICRKQIYALFGITSVFAVIGCTYPACKAQPAHRSADGNVAEQNADVFHDQKATFEILDNRMKEILAVPMQTSWAVHIAIESGDAAFIHETTLKARKAFGQSAQKLKALPHDGKVDDTLYPMIYGSGGFIELYIEHANLMESSYADAQQWLETGRVGKFRSKYFEKADRKLNEAERAWIQAKNYVSLHPYMNR